MPTLQGRASGGACVNTSNVKCAPNGRAVGACTSSHWHSSKGAHVRARLSVVSRYPNWAHTHACCSLPDRAPLPQKRPTGAWHHGMAPEESTREMHDVAPLSTPPPRMSHGGMAPSHGTWRESTQYCGGAQPITDLAALTRGGLHLDGARTCGDQSGMRPGRARCPVGAPWPCPGWRRRGRRTWSLPPHTGLRAGKRTCVAQGGVPVCMCV